MVLQRCLHAHFGISGQETKYVTFLSKEYTLTFCCRWESVTTSWKLLLGVDTLIFFSGGAWDNFVIPTGFKSTTLLGVLGFSVFSHSWTFIVAHSQSRVSGNKSSWKYSFRLRGTVKLMGSIAVCVRRQHRATSTFDTSNLVLAIKETPCWMVPPGDSKRGRENSGFSSCGFTSMGRIVRSPFPLKKRTFKSSSKWGISIDGDASSGSFAKGPDERFFKSCRNTSRWLPLRQV